MPPQRQKHFEQQKHSHWRTCQWPSHGRYPNWIIDVVLTLEVDANYCKFDGVYQTCIPMLQSTFTFSCKVVTKEILRLSYFPLVGACYTCVPPFLRQAHTRPWEQVIHLSQWFSVALDLETNSWMMQDDHEKNHDPRKTWKKKWP